MEFVSKGDYYVIYSYIVYIYFMESKKSPTGGVFASCGVAGFSFERTGSVYQLVYVARAEA